MCSVCRQAPANQQAKITYHKMNIQLKSVIIKQYCDSQPDSARPQLIPLPAKSLDIETWNHQNIRTSVQLQYKNSHWRRNGLLLICFGIRRCEGYCGYSGVDAWRQSVLKWKQFSSNMQKPHCVMYAGTACVCLCALLYPLWRCSIKEKNTKRPTILRGAHSI